MAPTPSPEPSTAAALRVLQPRDGVLALVRRHGAWWLALAVLIVYLPCLPGDYLVYDDAWLIERNRVLEWDFGAAWRAIWLDWDLETRLMLGAEYLPLRDLSHWLEVQLFGRHAPGMRSVQLVLYVLAVCFLRAALLRSLPSRASAELASWCFALHPVHAESVAWIAGRKDVLAMFFVCAALYAYEQRGRWCWLVPPLLLLAHFSKAMSVVAVGLLLAQDLLARRRPRWPVLGVGAAVAIVAAGLHHEVGARVSMVGGPLSGDRVRAALTMGEVWLRYAWLTLYPPALSVVHEVTPLAAPTLGSIAGWALLLGTAAWSALRAAAGRTGALAVWSWAVLPLVPVSQLVFPLQNVMADRYLWLSVLALGLGLGSIWARGAIGQVASGALIVLFAWGSAWRAQLFGDAAQLFGDAASKSRGGLAPYQLAMTYERRGDAANAARAYRAAIDRPCVDCEWARRASNNLARLLVRERAPEQAERVLRAALSRWPHDPKVHFNLVKVLARLGKTDEAHAVYRTARTRFPDAVQRALGAGGD